MQFVLRELGDVMTERVAAQSVLLQSTSGTVTVPLAEPVARLSQGRARVLADMGPTRTAGFDDGAGLGLHSVVIVRKR
jgi:hypothetical protein